MDDQHPAVVAKRWTQSFSMPLLSNTAYAKQLRGPLNALVYVHSERMPLAVRLYVLVHGRIPKSYLENFRDRS